MLTNVDIGEKLDDALQVHAIALIVVAAIAAAVAAQTGLDSVGLRGKLEKLPFNVAEDRMSVSQIECVIAFAMFALRGGQMACLQTIQPVAQFIYMTTCSHYDYCNFTTLLSWGDTPPNMKHDVVKVMLRDLNFEDGANMGKVVAIGAGDKSGTDRVKGVTGCVPRTLALLKFLEFATKHCHEFSNASHSLYEGEAAQINNLVKQFEKDFLSGRPLRPDRKPSDSLLSKCLLMKSTRIGPIDLKECCSEQSFAFQKAAKSFDGKPHYSADTVAVITRCGSHVPADSDRAEFEGYGRVIDTNLLENMHVRANAYSITEFTKIGDWQPWMDTVEFFRAEADFNVNLFLVAEQMIFREMIRNIQGEMTFAKSILHFSDRKGVHGLWDQYYVTLKTQQVGLALNQRLAALEQRGPGTDRVPSSLPRGGAGGGGRVQGPPPVRDPPLKQADSKPLAVGCQYSTMAPTKAKAFELMNLDFLPFDNGIGCAEFHNQGRCAAGRSCQMSHACPLKACNGHIHAFKIKHQLSWRGKSDNGPYSKTDDAKEPHASPAKPGAKGGGKKGAKGKGVKR